MSLSDRLDKTLVVQVQTATQDAAGGALIAWSTVTGAAAATLWPASAAVRDDYARRDIVVTHRAVFASDLNLSPRHRLLYFWPATTAAGLTRSGGTATLSLPGGHDLYVGDVCRVSGADQSAYNGIVEVTAATPTSVSYAVSGSPATPATGTVRVEEATAYLVQGAEPFANSAFSEQAPYLVDVEERRP